MQQGLPVGDAFRPSVSARIGSLDVDVSSVQVDREMPDPLAGGGLSAATASLSATVGDDVSSTVATPWDAGATWPPTPEASASVSLDVGPGVVQSLTGRVTEVSGGTSGREVDVDVADLYSTLDRTISWDALADQMPHPTEGEFTRFVGLHSMAVTDLMFRTCGWYATPPRLGFSVLSVPANGTLWPEVGTLTAASTYGRPPGDTGIYPVFYRTAWGLGASYTSATYDLSDYYTLKSRGHMELVAMTNTIGGRSSMGITASTGGGSVRLSWTNDTIIAWVTQDDNSLLNAGSLPRVAGLAYAQIDYVTDTSVKVTLQNAAGTVTSKTVACKSTVTTTTFKTGLIQGDHLGAGFQIAFPGSTAGALSAWKPNAVFHRGPASHMLKVRPPVNSENITDLLAQQAEAENATYWIDETGVMQWWHLSELELQPNVATLTADENITEGGFTWSHDLSSVKSRVIVKWKDWAYKGSTRSTIELWRGSGETLEPGQVSEEFVEADDNEVWIQPDLAFSRVGGGGGGTATIEDFNKGRRSWWGGILEDTDTWAQTQSSLAFSMSAVAGGVFKVTVNWTGTSSAELKTPSSAAVTEVSLARRSWDLPVLRGKGKFTFTDREYTAAQTGPATAPEHVIDAGWWIQEVEQAQRIANYAASRLTVAQPVLSAVDLVLAPGIQLGDVVTIQDDAVSRLTIKGIVTADSRSIDDGMSVSHSITVRPLAVTRNMVTWMEWGAFMNSAKYQTWGASQAGKTWQQWGAAPLEA